MPLDDANEAIAREREILRALCVAEINGSERARALANLASYRFCDPHHQILFDVLRELPHATPEWRRERLPALLTRRGFPDFDLDFFLSSSRLSANDVSAKDLAAVIEKMIHAPGK